MRALADDEPIGPELIPHVLPLLAHDVLAPDVVKALRSVSAASTGLLVDYMMDSRQDISVRRRVARLLSGCHSDRAVQGLFQGLEDSRFEVRAQCGRSLAHIRKHAPNVVIDQKQVFAAVLKEVGTEKPLWVGSRDIHRKDDPAASPSEDEYLRGRATSSLEHVFTLLSLALEPEPLKIAFQGLQSHDQHMRGTALEYLEHVLPTAVRAQLWPFLEERRKPARPAREREDIVSELMDQHKSIEINLKELRKLHEGRPAER